jgi:hypothetical protein
MIDQLVTALPPVVSEYIDAVNALDNDRIVATFAPDAYVNDDRREIWGIEAIRKFIAKETVGDRVSMEVREVVDHYGDNRASQVRRRLRQTNLPEELILTNYFSVRDAKIVSLTIVYTQPSP